MMRTHRFKRGQAASGGQGADPVADDAMDVDVPRDVITMVTRDVAVHRARFVEIDYPDAVATTIRVNRLRIDVDLSRVSRARVLPPGRPSLARNAKGIPGKRISLRQTVGGHTAPCVETGVQFADPLPAGSVYVSIRDNYSKADDAKLRFVPYFGENDDIHVEKTDLFDLDCDSETDGFDEETDYVVGRVIGRHGRSPTILAALSQVLPVSLRSLTERYGTGHAARSGHDLLDSYHALFCRRCFVYNCPLHPVDQPRRRSRQLPVDSDPCLRVPCAVRLPPTSPCSTSCYSADPTQATVEFSQAEVALFHKLVRIFDGDWCRIAPIVRRSCGDVERFARQSGVEFVAYDDRQVPTWKRKSASGYKKRSAASLPRRVNEIHRYEPCDHDGPCTGDGLCACVNAGHFCEKYCGCDASCKRRFTGCRCTAESKRCQTRRCPCFAAGRECDKDLCGICGMGSTCRNDSIQERRKSPILLAPSGIHGWGAFAGALIREGDFVTEYVGDLISQKEADRRGLTYDKRDCSYLFNLNMDNVIDACSKGNKIKYANHSDAPNCCARIVVIKGDHRIGIFAKRDIQPGEELFFDYNHCIGEGAPNWFNQAHSRFQE
ncbi:[histone H3]-lysine(27) N-trimethyltransferase [Plasmodiophora brassicae]|uniref:Uncharacterized protein n=2 Tax=Plasmodiophora brassicae TaxID=37360 RepID=A0A3P3YBC3_PLABS|nr:unnamed protein product [Plasmodiophora brassicae]